MTTVLRAVDRLDVLVLVDNATDSLSTNPGGVVSEWAGLFAAGRLPRLAGDRICCAHHGLSLLLTARAGGEVHTLLFDAGPAAATFTRNADILGVDFSAIADVVLSHGHWDHAGGLVAAVEAIAAARGGAAVRCHVHPEMFGERANRLPNGDLYVNERVPDPATLAKAGAGVVSTRDAQLLADGTFYVSGEIPRLTRYETGVPGHVRRSADGRSWEPDPLIMDERFVAVHVKDRGQVVFSACSHAGIVNVLTHARSVFPSIPLFGAVGGLHLSGATEAIIPETVADLKRFDLGVVAAGHCTGWRALGVMARELGGRLAPTAVGKRYVIPAQPL